MGRFYPRATEQQRAENEKLREEVTKFKKSVPGDKVKVTAKSLTCDECGFVAKNPGGLRLHAMKHIKEK